MNSTNGVFSRRTSSTGSSSVSVKYYFTLKNNFYVCFKVKKMSRFSSFEKNERKRTHKGRMERVLDRGFNGAQQVAL